MDGDVAKSTVTITGADFKEKTASGFSLVYFWAEWCGPCRMVGPIVEEIAGELKDKLKVYKLDADADPELTVEYGVRGIPTMIFFKDGEPIDRIVGAAPKSVLLEFLGDMMAN